MIEEILNERFQYSMMNGVVDVWGKAIPQDAIEVWSPFLSELNDYINGRPFLILNFKLDFYNTSSSWGISKMFEVLNKYYYKCKITVNWCYLEDDEDMLENGEIYQERNPKLNIKLTKIIK